MYKNLFKYILIFIIGQVITYYVAGIFARFVLGASQFYPPSLQAIRYLRDPSDPAVQGWVLPAQMLRGFLFAIVLFPFRRRLAELGPWLGGLAVMSIILVMGYIAASGGMIEHFLFFRSEDYPLKFALITFIEILIQASLMGVIIIWLDRRYIKN